MTGTRFEYSNLSGRPPGPVVAALARVLPGVRAVQEHVEPYARAWERSNLESVERIAGGDGWWAVLGDSMSQGIGASAPDRGWVGRLEPEVGLAVVNLSFNGARIADVADRQLPAMQDLAERAGRPPSLVTLMVGNNDMSSPRWRREIPTALPALLRRLPEGTVVTSQPAPHGAARLVNEAVDAAAREGRIRVAEFRVREMRSWRGRLAADHFHPNDAGYAAMADVVRRALPPLPAR